MSHIIGNILVWDASPYKCYLRNSPEQPIFPL